MMDFIALDFETANHQRDSVCEIGIAIVKEGSVQEQRSWLVKPRENWFNRMNTRIHGIDAKKVANEPEFDALWPDLCHYFEGAYVVAHNASFDLSVLRHVLSRYEIAFPELNYACSLQVARRAWKGFPSYGLGPLSQRFGIQLKHHAAGSDAEASARIMLKAMQEHGLKHFEEIEPVFGLRVGHLYAQGYVPSGRVPTKKKKKQTLQEFPIDLSRVNPEHPLYGKAIAFTGTLKSMSRAEAQRSVIEAGGHAAKYVNEQTHYLVLSEKVFTNVGQGVLNNKVRLAGQVNNQGNQVKLISEKEFLRLLRYS